MELILFVRTVRIITLIFLQSVNCSEHESLHNNYVHKHIKNTNPDVFLLLLIKHLIPDLFSTFVRSSIYLFIFTNFGGVSAFFPQLILLALPTVPETG